mmetsp:Transcript_30933/g.59745  ORF Transcript_30933/g.59745 Transcript_30933/m.59745 type:complete len:445 (-) Transcript_30933:1252-2586(-)
MDSHAPPCGQPMAAANAELVGLLKKLDVRVQQLKGNASEPPEVIQDQSQQQQQQPRKQQFDPPCRRAALGTFGAILGRSPSTARCRSQATVGLDLQLPPMQSSPQYTSPLGGGRDAHINKFTAADVVDAGNPSGCVGEELWARMVHVREEVTDLRNQLDENLRKLGEQQDQAEAKIEELRVRLLDILTPDMLKRSKRVGRLRERLELLRHGVGSEQAECVRVLSAVLSRMESKRVKRLAPPQHVSTEVQVDLPSRSQSKEPPVRHLADGTSGVTSAPTLHGIGVHTSPTQRHAAPGIRSPPGRWQDGDRDPMAPRRGRGQQQLQQQRQPRRDVVAQFKGAGVSADLGCYSSMNRSSSRPSSLRYGDLHGRQRQQQQQRQHWIWRKLQQLPDQDLNLFAMDSSCNLDGGLAESGSIPLSRSSARILSASLKSLARFASTHWSNWF